MAAKRPTRTGITRAVLLRPDQDARLNRLAEQTGLCRNQIVRLIADKATTDDIDDLLAR